MKQQAIQNRLMGQKELESLRKEIKEWEDKFALQVEKGEIKIKDEENRCKEMEAKFSEENKLLKKEFSE